MLDITDIHIDIKLFGGLRIVINDACVVNTVYGGQIWDLFAYLICTRKRTVTKETLCNAIYDGAIESAGDAALKNLVYRLRQALYDSGVDCAQQLIISANGTYRWNDIVKVTVDVETFESMCRMTDSEADTTKKLELLSHAMECYKGIVLPEDCSHQWVRRLRAKCAMLYRSIVSEIFTLCEESQDWKRIVRVANDALKYDPEWQMANGYILTAMLNMGGEREAVDRYNSMKRAASRWNETCIPNDVEKKMEQLMKPKTDDYRSLNSLIGEMREGEVTGAYYCDYESFKQLYQLKARGAMRDGESVSIGVIGIPASHDAAQHMVNHKTMQAMRNAIQRSLRINDAFAKCSDTQYVLLLMNVSDENGKMVLQRITDRFKTVQAYENVEVLSEIKIVKNTY